MTLNELNTIYNFHDCVMFTPIKQKNNDIFVSIYLCTHLQNDNLKQKYIKFLNNNNNNCIVIFLKFENCNNIIGKSIIYEKIKNNKNQTQIFYKIVNEKIVPIFDITDTLPDEPIFNYLCINNKSFSAYFREFGGIKENIISFSTDNVIVLKEMLLDKDSILFNNLDDGVNTIFDELDN